MVVYNPIIMDSCFITLQSEQLFQPIGRLISNSTRLERMTPAMPQHYLHMLKQDLFPEHHAPVQHIPQPRCTPPKLPIPAHVLTEHHQCVEESRQYQLAGADFVGRQYSELVPDLDPAEGLQRLIGEGED